MGKNDLEGIWPVTWAEYVIPEGKTPSVAAWCDKNISPRRYWLHNAVGAHGWKIISDQKGAILKVEDPEMLTYAILKFGPP